MSQRLPDAARGAPLRLLFEGSPVRAFAGESVAAGLFASDVRVLSRSLKYHRPRSFFCLDGHCGGCLMRVDGIPNVRACMTPCRDGLAVAGQNSYPAPDFDVLGAVDWMFPRGMDHHTLMTSSRVLSALTQKIVRRLSGLGTLPARAAGNLPEVSERRVDVAIVGGGPAGLAAAAAAARGGASVLLVDEGRELGGRLLCDPRFGRDAASERVSAARAAGAELWQATTAIGYFAADADALLAVATAERLVHVRAERFVYATGGYSVNAAFADNDRPGVLAARAVGRLLVEHGVLAAARICLLGSSDYGDALAAALRAAGAEVERIPAPLPELAARGRAWVRGLKIGAGAQRRSLACELIAVDRPPAPASELPRQHGCETHFDASRGGFAVAADARGKTSSHGVLCGRRRLRRHRH